jgi:hypothetical protein
VPGDWFSSIVQENEGIPNPDSGRRCVLLSWPVAGPHGEFLGYHAFRVRKWQDLGLWNGR